jgi:uncharacterized protein (TIGR03435 family)
MLHHMKPFLLLWMSILCCCAAFGQQSAEKPAFEVASIKPAQPMPMGMMRISMNADAGMLRYTNVSLKDCIRVAYDVKDFQIQGPDWIDRTRFDITAKLPDGSSKDEIPQMLQTLLAERFKLSLRRESKESPIYALVPAKGGPKLKPAEIPVDSEAAKGPGEGKPPRGTMMMMMDPSGMHLKAPSATLSNLAEAISRFTARPVVDMTGIQGQYDFDLVFAPENMRGMRMAGPGGMPPGAPAGGSVPSPAGGGPVTPATAGPSTEPTERAGSIFDAVQRYGLKLEPRKAPLDILIVDHIEKVPTEN